MAVRSNVLAIIEARDITNSRIPIVSERTLSNVVYSDELLFDSIISFGVL